MPRALPIGASLIFVLSCAASNAGNRLPQESASTSDGPRIDSIRPESGPAGPAYPIEVTVFGGPFDSTGNVVRFGTWEAATVPSEDGTTLTFMVPKTVRMSAEVPPMVVQAGEYPIVVETAAGVSEPVAFRLTFGGGG